MTTKPKPHRAPVPPAAAAAAAATTAPAVQSEFISKLKYSNRLPGIPCDARLVALPFDSSKFVAYRGTSLEQGYKYELHPPRDLGIPWDFIDPASYAHAGPGETPKLAPEDQELITWTDVSAKKAADLRREVPKPTVTWLRRPEYLATESAMTRPSRKSMDQLIPPAAAALAAVSQQESSAAAAELVRAIEDTFVAANSRVPVNSRNPSLTAVDVFPVFPAFELWPNEYSHVTLECDPMYPDGPETPEQQERSRRLSRRAIIKGFSTTEGDSLVTFLVPENEDAEEPSSTRGKKRPRPDGEDEGEAPEKGETDGEEYKWIRAFTYSVSKLRKEKDRETTVVLTLGPSVDGSQEKVAQYFKFKRRIVLKKIKERGLMERVRNFPRPAKIRVVKVPFSETEVVERDQNLARLLDPSIQSDEEGDS